MYLVSKVLDIRLNALTSQFLTTSATQSFRYGSLILLQILLHLLILILKGKNRFFTINISNLWSYFTIDCSLKCILLSLLLVNYNQKNVIAKINISFYKSKHFIILCHSFSLNNCERLIYHQLQ